MAATSKNQGVPNLIDSARIEWKLGKYGMGQGKDLKNPAHWQKTQEYRRIQASRLIPIEKKDIRPRLPSGEYHVSRKVDGELAVLVYEHGEALLVNPGGTVRVGLPLLADAAKKLGKGSVKSALLAGELYYRHPDGSRSRVHDVSRVARAPSSQEELDRLCLAVFDVIEIDGQKTPAKHADTFAKICKLFSGKDRVHPVDAITAKTPEDIEKCFADWVEGQGGEGLVLRSDTVGSYKLKPRHTLDVAVIGYTEGTEDRKGMLHDLLCAVIRKDGGFQILGRVGTGFSDEERRTFVADLKHLHAKSDYAEIGDGHIAYQMVRPVWVIEISCLDLISQSTRGVGIDKMVLSYDEKQACYVPIRRMPLGSLISPVFVRRRDDKHANSVDVRAQQISDLVEVAQLEKDARTYTLPVSQVLRREVYVKTLKGQTAVRKLLLWKTNKETEGDFPAYVLHYTDYSPTRKEPLSREIRVSASRDQIEGLWKTLHSENIVKGWVQA
ncbi:MAG TPA: hypothetical protein PKE31_17785 [Pseudomonadota bacterium]|jgi:hypothetical protein|nr:hypothetical protein [Pseudomonadota bacterium]